MKEFWVALGIVLMALPFLYYLRITFLEGRVLVVPIYGEIDTYYGSLYSEWMKEGEDYDAVVLEIDSPGGTLGGVREVISAIEYLKERNKTVIAYVKEAMSGAYWVASYCDYIFADNLSMLGNVGVTASFLNFAGLLKRFNVSYIEIYNGSLKEMGSPFKEPTEEELRRLREIVNQVYKVMLESIKRNRNLTEEQLEKVATSDVFFGFEGKNLGLVDFIGTWEDLEEFLKKELGKEEITFYYPEGIQDLLD